jgi:hypothetical protein
MTGCLFPLSGKMTARFDGPGRTMLRLNEITDIEYRGGHVYYLRFDDGSEGDVDFSEYIGRGPVFEAFADLGFFQKARVEAGTISWPNGVDIASETLHEKVRQEAHQP